MIRDYQAFLARRWNELDMPAKTRAAADNEDTQRPIQVAWLIQAVGELRHTTLHEGREHPDVGLLFKDSGNHFDAGNGLKIANDIICVRDTNAAGEVTDPRIFAIVDCIVSVNRHAAHPGWIVNGMAVGADVARFRDAPVPVTAQRPPEPAGPTGTETANRNRQPASRHRWFRPPGSTPTPRARSRRLPRSCRRCAPRQDADRELQQKILGTLEGLRRDLDNTGKLLVAVMGGGGGLGNIADLVQAVAQWPDACPPPRPAARSRSRSRSGQPPRPDRRRSPSRARRFTSTAVRPICSASACSTRSAPRRRAISISTRSASGALASCASGRTGSNRSTRATARSPRRDARGCSRSPSGCARAAWSSSSRCCVRVSFPDRASRSSRPPRRACARCNRSRQRCVTTAT